MRFDARYVFIEPPSVETLEGRLRESGAAAEEVTAAMSGVAQDMEHAKSAGFDKTIVNQDLEAACKSLEEFIYGMEEEAENLTNGTGEAQNGSDVAMTDAANGADANAG